MRKTGNTEDMPMNITEYPCENPKCRNTTSEWSLTCNACDSLRENGEADICDVCGVWSEKPHYDDDYAPICDSCQ